MKTQNLERRLKKRTAPRAALMAAVLAAMTLGLAVALTGCGDDSEKGKIGDLTWLMTPSTEWYYTAGEHEPADSYSDVYFDDELNLYCLSLEQGGIRYLTPEGAVFGEDAELSGEYDYLADMPIPVDRCNNKEGDDYRLYDEYIFADGTPAFEGEFWFAMPFQGDFAYAKDEDGREHAINKKGEIVYTASKSVTEFRQVSDNIFSECTRDNRLTLVDVKHGEILHAEENCVRAEKTSLGYVLYHRIDDDTLDCVMVDEDFQPLWDGRSFEDIEEARDEKGETVATGGKGTGIFRTIKDSVYTYLDKDGKRILELPEGAVGVASGGRVMSYTGKTIVVYDYDGQKLFEKKLKDGYAVIPEDYAFEGMKIGSEGYVCGVAVISLDGEKYGIMDMDGKMLTGFSFDCAKACSNGTVLVGLNWRAGVLGVNLSD